MKHYRRFIVAIAALLLTACASLSPAPVVDRGGAGTSSAAAAAAAKDLYTVKKGDTLFSIALDHGLDHRELATWNNIENPNRIRIGQQLRVKPPVPVGSDSVVTQPIGSNEAMVEQRSLDSSAPVAAADSSTPQFKTEPKAGKVPYSEEALAQAQRAPDVVAPKPESKPEVKAEPKLEAKPVPSGEPSAGADDMAWIWPASGKVVGQFSEAGSKGLDIGGKAGDPVIATGDGKVVYAGTGLRGYGKLIIVKHNATFLSAYAHNQNLLVKEGQSVTKGQKIAEMGSSDADQVKLHFEIRRQGKPVDPLKYLPPR